MLNPIVEARERLEFTRRQFTVLFDVPSGTLSAVESGHVSTVSKVILQAFKRAGMPEEEILVLPERYRNWRCNEVHEELARKNSNRGN